MVQSAARRPQGARSLVRLPQLPPGADGRGRAIHAAVHRRGGYGWRACAGSPADRYRKVALLSDSGSVPLRQDGRPDGGDLAPGCSHGRPGDGAREAGHRFLCDHQWAPVHARASRCPGPRADGGCRHPHHLARAASQRLRAPSAGATGDRCMGSRRGSLPIQVGARLPARLPLRRTLHPREGGRRPDAARVVSDCHGQA